MKIAKSSISQAHSYRETGEFWDTHEITDFWDATEPVEFEVDIQSETRYYALDRKLVEEVGQIAWQRGISVETLLNLWVYEKIAEEPLSVIAA